MIKPSHWHIPSLNYPPIITHYLMKFKYQMWWWWQQFSFGREIIQFLIPVFPFHFSNLNLKYSNISLSHFLILTSSHWKGWKEPEDACLPPPRSLRWSFISRGNMTRLLLFRCPTSHPWYLYSMSGQNRHCSVDSSPPSVLELFSFFTNFFKRRDHK